MTWLIWVTAIEIPVILALVAAIVKVWLAGRAEIEQLRIALAAQRTDLTDKDAAILKTLTDFMLTVAREYASVGYLKDVETRQTAALEKIEKHLERIENRLLKHHPPAE